MEPIIDAEHQALPEGDYVLTEAGCWIQIGNIAVRVIQTDEAVICELYPHGREKDEPLASTFAFFDEATNAIQEAEKDEA